MVERPAPPNREFYESMSAANSAVDPITGFLNRNAGLQAVARAVTEANSKRSLLAVLWVDMDRFRQVNDSFGHAGGDSVIVRIAERIRSGVSMPGEFVATDHHIVNLVGTVGEAQMAHVGI